MIQSYQFKYHIPRKDIFMNSNKIETEYKTDNYKITLIRLPKIYQYSSYKFICYIDIKSIINLPIVNIKCTEIDIIKLLDNFYYSISNTVSTMYFFNNIDLFGNYNCIKLDIDNSDFEYKYHIKILQYNISIETIVELCDIVFNSFSDICNFLDLLYMTFLVNNVDIDNSIKYSLLYPEIYDE